MPTPSCLKFRREWRDELWTRHFKKPGRLLRRQLGSSGSTMKHRCSGRILGGGHHNLCICPKFLPTKWMEWLHHSPWHVGGGAHTQRLGKPVTRPNLPEEMAFKKPLFAVRDFELNKKEENGVLMNNVLCLGVLLNCAITHFHTRSQSGQASDWT